MRAGMTNTDIRDRYVEIGCALSGPELRCLFFGDSTDFTILSTCLMMRSCII
jgi:hypothetical protein